MMLELANITITSHGQKLEELPTYMVFIASFERRDLLYVGKSVDISVNHPFSGRAKPDGTNE